MGKKANLEYLRKINQELVLETIREKQPISRAEISRRLNLSRSTVSTIVDRLIKNKFVVELGLANTTKDGGKPGMMLGFNPKSGYGVGVDIGGTKILILITDLDGNLLHSEKHPSSSDIEKINQLTKDAIGRSGINEDDLLAIGFGIPGITDSDKGIVLEAPALQWKNKPFIREVEPFFTAPIFINNDVNCAAIGERWLGSAKYVDDIVHLSIGTGVGGAIITGGQLVQGFRNMAGEVAYLVEREDWIERRENRFSDFGLFEKKVSGTALSDSGFTSEELFQQYRSGNQVAIKRIEQFMLTLSIAIANIASLLNPEMVVIGGGVSRSMNVVIDQIREMVANLTPIECRIELASLGEQSAAYGAIAYALEKARGGSG